MVAGEDGNYRFVETFLVGEDYQVTGVAPDIGPGKVAKVTIKSLKLLVKKGDVWKWAINGKTASKETLKKVGQAKPNLTTSKGKTFKEGQEVLKKITPKTRLPKGFWGK